MRWLLEARQCACQSRKAHRAAATIENAWGNRVTTVFPRQGQYAHDAKALASFAQPDVTVDRIGDLLAYDLGTLVGGRRTSTPQYAEDNR